MRRNRKVKKSSVLTSSTIGISSLLFTAFIAVLAYYFIDSRCSSIAREIGKAEKRLAALETEYVREAAKWDELKIPERLAEKLTRFGLEMRYARQDQIVRMTPDGRPAPGQLSVARANARMRNGASATMLAGQGGRSSEIPSLRQRAIRR